MIEGAQDVVIPARREDESCERRLDDLAGAMGAVEAMAQEKLAPAALSRADRPGAPPMRLVQPQTFEHAQRRVHRRVLRDGSAPTVPASVPHLPRPQVRGDPVDARVVDPEVGQERKDHPRDARLAAMRPLRPRAVADAAVDLEPPIEEDPARLTRATVAGRKPEVAQQKQRIRRRRPLRRIQPAVRGPPARPGSGGILARKQTRAPAFPRDPSPLVLDAPLVGAGEVAERLPADRRVALEEPAHRPVRRSRRGHRFQSGTRSGAPSTWYSLCTRPLGKCRVATWRRRTSPGSAPKSGMPSPIRTGTRVTTRRWMSPAARNRWIVIPPSTYACRMPRAS